MFHAKTGGPREPGACDNVFLVGLMGAGKTSVGKVLARRLRKEFVDCDAELERVTGVKIPVIFEIEGESGFRARESKLLSELVARRNIVLATGGGVVLWPGNRALLSLNGIVVYLRAAPADLWHRTRHDRNRPLLANADPAGTLERLFHERHPLYSEIADIILDTGNQSLGSLAGKLERRLKQLRATLECEGASAGEASRQG